MRKLSLIFYFVIILLSGCKKKSYLYEVNEIAITPNSSNQSKTKEKRPEQFISILYANIFQKPLSPNELVDLSELIQSIGDKQLAFELIVSNFLCDEAAQIPGNSAMRNDVAAFVEQTYQRFYVREPSGAEKAYFVNFINSNPNLTPENIYFAFALSDEYYYY